jgi:hypothetical protein
MLIYFNVAVATSQDEALQTLRGDKRSDHFGTLA